MHIPMIEFEQIATSCGLIFNTWDEEHDKVSTILRDMMKKRREPELLKLSQSRTQYKHTALETRLKELQKFRTQHEQLRTVISRVIRRPGTGDKAIGLEVNGETDGNTIEQVIIMNL